MRLTEDSIKQLLEDADAAAPRIASSGDVAACARRRLAGRSSIRRGALACSMLFLIATTFLAVIRSRTQVAQNSTSQAPPAARQFAAMSIDADLHELTANKLLTAASARRAVVDEATPALADLQLQRDRAALMLVY